MAHHLDDYECMWNGIEDLYIRDTGEKLPPSFFFSLASFGSFRYMKTNKSDIKRLVALGDGRTKQMYKFLAPIVGFEYKHYEYKNFEKALAKAKSEIDNQYPCVIGAIDMYYLSYYSKLYHGEHIPFHYVLMVGYDDEAQCVFLFDCGCEEMQKLSYEELRLAWDCSYAGLSKPNTICTIRMGSTKNKYEIAKEALAKKRDIFLNPPTNFIGYRGFEKLIKELPNWKEQLSKEDYDKLLTNMVMFFGDVPTIPNVLKGINKPDAVEFAGGFNKISRVLGMLGQEYEDENLEEVAVILKGGSSFILEIKNIITQYLTKKNDRTDELPGLFINVMEVMKNGFIKLKNNIEK